MIVIYFYASYQINFSIDSTENVEMNNNHDQALTKKAFRKNATPVRTD